MIPIKRQAPKCKECSRSLASGSRLIVDGWWLCADCEYRRDHPEAPPPASSKPLPLQAETLFEERG